MAPSNSSYDLKVLRPEELTDRIAILTGTRPGIIKFSPILRALEDSQLSHFVIHSGQHYSQEMDAIFFRELQLRRPEHRIDETRNFVYHGEQTAAMLGGIERVLLEERPWMLLVGGDCNTHLAGALAARKLHIQVGHVEAGMRSHDWQMPEEHNRVIIDHISDHLFVHNEEARDLLLGEGIRGQIHVVGTTIADAVEQNLELAKAQSKVLEQLSLQRGEYFLVTCHREENVDDERVLRGILNTLAEVGKRFECPVVFPAHPRTTKRIEQMGLSGWVQQLPHLMMLPPLGYLDFLALLAQSRIFLTDSGGGQQEACLLHVPCVTLRESMEWKETATVGANMLAGVSPEGILGAVEEMLSRPRNWPNPFGDGHTAEKLLHVLENIHSYC